MIWKNWHMDAAKRKAAGDITGARDAVVGALSGGDFDPNSLFDQTLRLSVAHESETGWITEAEDCATAAAVSDPLMGECLLLAWHMLGALAATTDSARALQFFERALSLSAFLPSLVEHKIIVGEMDRARVLTCLGQRLPKDHWTYLAAGASLGMPIGTKAPGPPAAIALRGLCGPETANIVKLYAALNPNAAIYISTWNDITPELRREIEAAGAAVVLSAPIDDGGEGNKIRQIIQAGAVLRRIAADGHERTLLTRTDLAIFRPAVINILSELLRLYPMTTRGPLRHRIVIPDIFTRKFQMNHPSDMLMFGNTLDLITYWDAPLDGGIQIGHAIPEIHLAANFRSRFSLYPDQKYFDGTWALLRDFFIVRDLDWLEACWLKYPSIRWSDFRLIYKCISQAEWESLVLGGHQSAIDGGIRNGMVLEDVFGLRMF